MLLKGLTGEWRNVRGMKAREVAEMVRADKVDILVDLTGHTSSNRLDVLAMKPGRFEFFHSLFLISSSSSSHLDWISQHNWAQDH